ncbi:hemagglutinin/hemolysin [Yersinia pseudotuberculosis]|uniref:two-partner secretion domain-containing protein n=1 Tax=Yersinia pseudotuberculosis TaxID=633 RepID=UPI00061CB6B4|nr:filamentous hemagglutinin N-terminal domain-containing protein [Yersinia pseudotuberculosis]CNG23621.1 hemagglutinin/hemolysin [Yersinia pseudotuberculosis]
MKLTYIKTKQGLSILPLSIILSLYGSSVAYADNIIADVQAPIGQQAEVSIIKTPPSVCRALTSYCVGMTETVVNIQAPDENGLSHNKYSKFDVVANGLFDVTTLNNRLAQEVDGNSFLQDKLATIILNEVNSSQASLLDGNLHVGGQDAHVIIANPAGINCRGCSFTNTSHVTLTTGAPSFSNNKLNNFIVEQGNINIEKDPSYYMKSGLRNKSMDTTYLDLFAGKITVNGDINADDVYIVTGKNKVGFSLPGQPLHVSRLDNENTPVPDTVSLDVSEIGGMYANKIRIYTTDSTIKNKGAIRANDTLSLSSAANIDNSNGNISGKMVLLSSEGVINNSGGTILNNGEYDLLPSQGIKITSRGLNNEGGKIEYKNGSVEIATVNTIKNGKGTIKATSTQGRVKMNLHSNHLNNTGGSIISSGKVEGKVNNIRNNRGSIIGLGGVDLNETVLINSTGKIISGFN